MCTTARFEIQYAQLCRHVTFRSREALVLKLPSQNLLVGEQRARVTPCLRQHEGHARTGSGMMWSSCLLSTTYNVTACLRQPVFASVPGLAGTNTDARRAAARARVAHR